MFKRYFLATRPWSFPVSSMSVLITAAFLYWRGWDVNWLLALWATVGIILFHAAGNLISDYYDYKKGIDAEDTFGSKTITGGLLTPKQTIVFGWVMLLLACVNGVGLVLCTGYGLLVFGLLGALFTLLYPWMKAHALGDLDILIEYGLLPALGTAYAVCGYQGGFALALFSLYLDALMIVPAFATITMAVLHTNNTRDVATDRRAGIKTFAMLIGREHSIAVYIVELALPIIWVLMLTLQGTMPVYAVCVLALIKPVSACCKQAILLEKDEHAMDTLDEKTAQLQLMNGILLIVFMLIGHFAA